MYQQAPDIYYQHVDASSPDINPLRMDVAGFVGIADQGPVDVPVPCNSYRQFASVFGIQNRVGFLHVTVKVFFENGGRRCWVVRVASRDSCKSATIPVFTKSATLPSVLRWQISASSPGAWGNQVQIELKESTAAQAVVSPGSFTSKFATVALPTGFNRFDLVRLSQEGKDEQYRVLVRVDPFSNTLHWVGTQERESLPYDEEVLGFDTTLPVLMERVAYTLQVKQEGRLSLLVQEISVIPEAERYGPQLLRGFSALRDEDTPLIALPIVIIEEAGGGAGNKGLPLDTGLGNNGRLSGGADGLSLLNAKDFVGEESSVYDSDEIRIQKQRGIRTLSDILEIRFIAVPDLHVQPRPVSTKGDPVGPEPDPCLPDSFTPPVRSSVIKAQFEQPPKFSEKDILSVQHALVDQCEQLGRCIALLDPPRSSSVDIQKAVARVQAWRQAFDSSFAASYWPWIEAPDVDNVERVTHIPPSGYAAGQIASTQTGEGVRRVPANTPLIQAVSPSILVGRFQHGALDTAGINVIRSQTGQGIRILGARTMSSEPAVRLLNVRLLLIAVKQSVFNALQWAVFEPNNIQTRAKIRLVLFIYLQRLWQRGALVGDTAEASFFVKCDDENNPPFIRDNGQLIVEIGIAPSKPLEFIHLRVGRIENAFVVADLSSTIRDE